MNELALFAGAGGGILAGKSLGWRTVCAVERDAYAAAVLAQRQNDGHLPAFPIWSDILSFDARAWRGIIEVISGGFPCQDISPAGTGEGITGKRSGLWTEMARIIREIKPRIVAHSNSVWEQQPAVPREEVRLRSSHGSKAFTNTSIERCKAGGLPKRKSKEPTITCQCSKNLANPNSNSIQRLEQWPQSSQQQRPNRLHDRARSQPSWGEWPPEPRVGRVVDGLACRVDRIKALGNGQVPRVAAMAYETLK